MHSLEINMTMIKYGRDLFIYLYLTNKHNTMYTIKIKIAMLITSMLIDFNYQKLTC